MRSTCLGRWRKNCENIINCISIWLYKISKVWLCVGLAESFSSILTSNIEIAVRPLLVSFTKRRRLSVLSASAWTRPHSSNIRSHLNPVVGAHLPASAVSLIDTFLPACSLISKSSSISTAGPSGISNRSSWLEIFSLAEYIACAQLIIAGLPQSSRVPLVFSTWSACFSWCSLSWRSIWNSFSISDVARTTRSPASVTSSLFGDGDFELRTGGGE